MRLTRKTYVNFVASKSRLITVPGVSEKVVLWTPAPVLQVVLSVGSGYQDVALRAHDRTFGDHLNFQELYEAFAEESARTSRPRLLLAAAVSAAENTIDNGYDIPELAK